MRGEWIEMILNGDPVNVRRRLSPCGESGLKSISPQVAAMEVMSLPMRGEWIEIFWYGLL